MAPTYLSDEEFDALPDAPPGVMGLSDEEFDALPDAAPTSVSTPEGGYYERFFKGLGGLKDWVGSAKDLAKGAYGAVSGPNGLGDLSPIAESLSNWGQNRNLTQKIGDIGGLAARYNPAFPITGHLYDRTLQTIDPENFPETTPEQDAAKFRGETVALGAMGAMKAGGAGISKVSDILNNPQRVARLSGATPTQMGPLRPSPVQNSIAELEKVSPEFRSGVMGVGSVTKQFDNANARLGQVGASIENAYGKASGVTADLADIQSHPAIQQLFDKATSDASIGKVAGEASSAYEQVMQPLERLAQQNGGRVSIGDLWNIRKSLDEIADLETANPTLSDQFLVDARSAIKDSINDAIDAASPADGAALKAMNNEYHHLANVRETLARGYAKEGGKLPGPLSIFDDKSPGSGSNTLGKLSGIGTGDIRALAYRARPTAEALSSAALPTGLALATSAQMESPDQRASSRPLPTSQDTPGIPGGLSGLPSQSGSNGAGRQSPEAASIGGQVIPSSGETAPNPQANQAPMNPAQAARILSPQSMAPTPQNGSLSGPVKNVFGGTTPAMMDGQVPPLPRDTDQLSPEVITNFLMSTAQRPDAPIAIGLADKLQKAMRAQDLDTVERLYADMAKLFPESFEEGQGVNGKLFHPDEQMKAMETLKQLQRMGVVDSIHLAKQRNAFNNPQDSRILPVKPAPSARGSGVPRFYEGTRVYDY